SFLVLSPRLPRPSPSGTPRVAPPPPRLQRRPRRQSSSVDAGRTPFPPPQPDRLSAAVPTATTTGRRATPKLLLAPQKTGFAAMGLFRGSFTFLVGVGCGVYIAQNYNVPNVKKLFNTYVFLAKHVEETYRKPKKDDD
ncbi:hypothetical protein U9M48_010422, partial [Paspalum notatum var. saurae]